MAFERIIAGAGKLANPNLVRLRASKYGGALTLGSGICHQIGIKAGERGKMGYGYDPSAKKIYFKKLGANDVNGISFTHKANDKNMNALSVGIPTTLSRRLLAESKFLNEEKRVSLSCKLVQARIDQENWWEIVPLS